MTLDLHPKCVDRLREGLPLALAEVRINSTHFLDYDSTEAVVALNSALPEHGPAHDALREFIGTQPLSTFVLARLRDVLKSSLPFDGEVDLPRISGQVSTCIFSLFPTPLESEAFAAPAAQWSRSELGPAKVGWTAEACWFPVFTPPRRSSLRSSQATHNPRPSASGAGCTSPR